MTAAAVRLAGDRFSRNVMLIGIAAWAVLAMWLTRDTTLFFDETNIFAVDRGLDPSALFSPLNGHLVLFQRVVYAIDLKLFGPEFVPIRLLQVAGASLVVWLVYVMARRRIGPAAALAPAFLILFLGSAWELNVVVSGLGNVYAVAAGLGAFLLLERDDRSKRTDILACALLVGAVATFTVGLAFVLGAAALLLLGPEPRRRLWIVLVPSGAYAAWFVWLRAVWVPDNGEAQSFKLANVLTVPNFVADSAASAAGALAGLNYDFDPDNLIPVFSTDSQFGAALVVVAVAAVIVRVRRHGGGSNVLWALIVVLLAFWTLLAIGFGVGRNPSVVRYVYAGGILALLIGAEVCRGVRLQPRALLVLYLVTALATLGNLARLRDGTNFYRGLALSIRSELTALDLARDRVRPDFALPEGALKTAALNPGDYLAAARRNGSPAFSPAELLAQDESRRKAADTVLVAATGLTLGPASAEPVTNCRSVTGSATAPARVEFRSPGVRITSPTAGAVEVSRFADGPTALPRRLAPGRAVDLSVPPDAAKRAWRLTLGSASRPVQVCDLSR